MREGITGMPNFFPPRISNCSYTRGGGGGWKKSLSGLFGMPSLDP